MEVAGKRFMMSHGPSGDAEKMALLREEATLYLHRRCAETRTVSLAPALIQILTLIVPRNEDATKHCSCSSGQKHTARLHHNLECLWSSSCLQAVTYISASIMVTVDQHCILLEPTHFATTVLTERVPAAGRALPHIGRTCPPIFFKLYTIRASPEEESRKRGRPRVRPSCEEGANRRQPY
jgi:hypothetical protein